MLRVSVASTSVLVLSAAVAAAGATTAVARPRARPAGDPAVVARLAQAAGLQVGPKHRTRPSVSVGGRRYAAPDPALAELPAGSVVDQSYWRRRTDRLGLQRAARRTVAGTARQAVPVAVSHAEQEPTGTLGANDSPANAEYLDSLGTGTGKQFRAAQVDGRLYQPSSATVTVPTKEDQGSISRATRTGVGFTSRPQVRVVSRIGDGPHGRHKGGDGHGDFDFYKVRAKAGSTLAVDTRGSALDTVVALYDTSGHIVASNDDEDELRLSSALSYVAPRTATFYVMVAGFSPRGSVPARPFRSGSGAGAGEQGRYTLNVSSRRVDRDYYAVDLRSGDVLGAVLTGGKAHTVQVQAVDGAQRIGSQQDWSADYPMTSPLPGGGATSAYVAEKSGRYTVSVTQGSGRYGLRLETYRPGTEGSAVQTVFLDFDGERLNTAMFGGPGVVTLSPLSSFLASWGLSASDEDAVIDATVATVTRDLDTRLRAEGLNPKHRLRVLNSRDDADPFGDPDVSRVVVGGTIAQSGIPTIGIAPSIDPGNFAHEETALVLLDEVSASKGPEDSFNTYLKAGSDRVAFVGQGLGSLVAHETGHMVGSYHTDNTDSTANLMDSGGEGFARLFGVGPDKIGGTTDDQPTFYGVDAFAPEEGFLGNENTLNNTAWAFVLLS